LTILSFLLALPSQNQFV